jgi:hypothetical protein
MRLLLQQQLQQARRSVQRTYQLMSFSGVMSSTALMRPTYSSSSSSSSKVAGFSKLTLLAIQAQVQMRQQKLH